MTKAIESQSVEAEQQETPQPSAWLVVGAGLAVVVSSAIAFCSTCLPIGFVAFQIGFHQQHIPAKAAMSFWITVAAFVCGTLVALFVGYRVLRYFRKSWSKQ